MATSNAGNGRRVPMSEAIKFVQTFIDAEHRALHAMLGEEDDAKALQVIGDAQAMLATDTNLHFGRTLGLSSELRAKDRRLIPQYVPRTLFVVRRFSHPAFGEVAQAIVSWDEAYGQRRYYDSFFIARMDGDLRVIARYGLEDNPTVVRWKRETGADLGPLGAPIETARFAPPEDAVHRRDWERDS